MKSEVELFFRKFMSKLGLGYQCHYSNRSKRNYKRYHTYPGHWFIEIWDQRENHYKNVKGDDRNYSPTQKWYNNQSTDEHFIIVGPEYNGSGVEHKEEFLKWLLFESDFFKKLCDNAKEDYFKNDFCSKEHVQITSILKNGDDLRDLFEKFETLKKRN